MDPSQTKFTIDTLDAPHIAVLSTLLDAHLLFEEPELSKDAFQPYFELIWPGTSLGQCLSELCGKGLVATTASADYLVPKEHRNELAARLEADFFAEPVRIPGQTMGHEALIKSFLEFSRGEQQDLAQADGTMKRWGGWAFTSGHRIHHILFRPYLLRLKAHQEEYILVCTRFHRELDRAVSEDFVRNQAEQQRLGLFDLEGAQKMNLTKSAVVFYFERYLKRALGVRMGSTATFNQSLEDGGLLSLRMG